MLTRDKDGFDIVLAIRPETRWLPFVEAAGRSYFESHSYPRRLTDSCLSAIGEAAEQIIALCIEQSLHTPFEIGFMRRDGAISIHFIHHATLPLNPHQEPHYEVPTAEGALDEVALDGLWLHIIKRTMDRVFFRIEGSRASLIMMKYHRAERYARETWVLGLKPKLRPDLVLEYPPGPVNTAPSSCAIIHDTRGRSVLKLCGSDLFVTSRLDGKTTLRDLYLEYSVEIAPLSPLSVVRLYEELEAARLIESESLTFPGWNEGWTRRFSPIFTIPHADRIIDWIHRYCRFLFQPLGIAALLVGGLSGAIPLVQHGDALSATISHLDDQFLECPLQIAAAYGLMALFIALHELAHGVTCKHFGGQIRGLGVMWYLAMFIFFCDTTSAWTFPKKSQRILVSLAGPLTSWALWGATLWCAGWAFEAGSPWAAMWTAVIVMTSFGLVMNLNPLVRMDGYYILVDYAGIPNLQERAFSYLRSAILSRFTQVPPGTNSQPPFPERRLYVIYGALSAAMSLFLLVLPLVHLGYLWTRDQQFTLAGTLAGLVVLILMVSILFKAAGLIHAARRREYNLS